MDKLNGSQILKLVAIAAFLIITPLLSSSSRPTYLYFVVHLLIIALVAEAGLLSLIFKPAEEKIKPAASVGSVAQNSKSAENKKPNEKEEAEAKSVSNETADKVVKKCSSEKIVNGSPENGGVIKKCHSTPSLSFIGSSGGDDQMMTDEADDKDQFVEDDGEEGVEELSGQELFHKAEAFIGDFYKQLKMQREDSWNKLHEFYQKSLLNH